MSGPVRSSQPTTRAGGGSLDGCQAPIRTSAPIAVWPVSGALSGPDDIDRPAPNTFGTKSEAEVWLVKTEAEIRDDRWLNPDQGQIAFGNYARAWIEERPNLRPNTAQMYRYMLTRYLDPVFGNRPVAEIREAHVRRWRRELLDSGASATSVAKTYRLLRAIMSTAVDDGIIRRNPCRIRGAGLDR